MHLCKQATHLLASPSKSTADGWIFLSIRAENVQSVIARAVPCQYPVHSTNNKVELSLTGDSTAINRWLTL